MSHSPNYIIAISSVSGGGKTTLVKRTVDLLKGTALFFDDYASVSEYPSDFKSWVEEGANVNEWKTPQFVQDLTALRRGDSIFSPIDGASILPSEFIVIEEPMGRARAEMARLIDFVAVIDTPLEIALTRRLLDDISLIALEDVEKATKDQLVEKLAQITHLRDFLDLYLYVARDIYITVQEQAQKNCDLVLDGSRPADELAQQLVTAVKDKPRSRSY